MATTHDAIMRRKRLRPLSTGKRVTPQDSDLLWFAKLCEHGPLPSSFLLQFSGHLRRSEKRARERLTDLFHEENTPDGGSYLTRPPQQFRTLDSRYNQLVYDLTPAAERALRRAGLWVRAPVRSGPWVHSLMVSCVTASIELATLDCSDIHYISQARILARSQTDLRYQTIVRDATNGADFAKDLMPDALFGLEYRTPEGSRFRFYVVEADRATEPVASRTVHRKSFQRCLLQYEQYVGEGSYRDHLKLTAPLLVLHICAEAERTERLIEVAAAHHPGGNAYMLFQTWPDFGPVFRPPSPRPELLATAWARAGLPPFRIDRP
jgi:hypothetical protein